ALAVVGADAPSLRTPAVRRHPVAERATEHEGEIDDRHDQIRLRDAVGHAGGEHRHESRGERRADHRAAAEAHYRETRRHAAAIGEPFDQRRYRRNVAEAQTDAAEHAGAEPDEPELVDVDADRTERHAPAPAHGRHHARLARTGTFEPAAPDRGGDAEPGDEERER